MSLPLSPSTPTLLDVTVRDGSNLIQHKFSPDSVAQIAASLQKAGFEYAEISHGAGIGGRSLGFGGLAEDDDLLEAAKKAAPDLKLSVFILTWDYSLGVIPGLVDYFELGRIGVNVDKVSSAEKVIRKLKKFNKQVSIQLTRSHTRSPEFVARAAQLSQEMGADIVYLVDTFGSMNPFAVRNYMRSLKAAVKIPIGYHAHNHLEMASASTLAAWEEGASWLDMSLMGVGRGAGNAVSERLIPLLSQRGLKNLPDLSVMASATEKIIRPIFGRAPISRRIDIATATQKIDFHDDELLLLLANFLQLSLEDFMEQLRAKMGDEVQLNEAPLRALLSDYGASYEKVVELLKQVPSL